MEPEIERPPNPFAYDRSRRRNPLRGTYTCVAFTVVAAMFAIPAMSMETAVFWSDVKDLAMVIGDESEGFLVGEAEAKGKKKNKKKNKKKKDKGARAPLLKETLHLRRTFAEDLTKDDTKTISMELNMSKASVNSLLFGKAPRGLTKKKVRKLLRSVGPGIRQLARRRAEELGLNRAECIQLGVRQLQRFGFSPSEARKLVEEVAR